MTNDSTSSGSQQSRQDFSASSHTHASHSHTLSGLHAAQHSQPHVPVITPVAVTPASPEWLLSLQDLVAGTIGACAGIVAGQPLDTIKTRMQTSANYNGVWDCVMKTGRNEGVKAFYKVRGQREVG